MNVPGLIIMKQLNTERSNPTGPMPRASSIPTCRRIRSRTSQASVPIRNPKPKKLRKVGRFLLLNFMDRK